MPPWFAEPSLRDVRRTLKKRLKRRRRTNRTCRSKGTPVRLTWVVCIPDDGRTLTLNVEISGMMRRRKRRRNEQRRQSKNEELDLVLSLDCDRSADQREGLGKVALLCVHMSFETDAFPTPQERQTRRNLSQCRVPVPHAVPGCMYCAWSFQLRFGLTLSRRDSAFVKEKPL